MDKKKTPAAAKNGDLRVWWIPQAPGKPFHVPVADIAQAKFLITVLAAYDLFQFKNRIKPDYANAGGLEIFEDGEWSEWRDPDDNDLGDVMRREGAQPGAPGL